MNSLDLEEFGFTAKQIAKLPQDFIDFLFSHYNEIELKTLSIEAIMNGGAILYSIYHPSEEPIPIQDILKT